MRDDISEGIKSGASLTSVDAPTLKERGKMIDIKKELARREVRNNLLKCIKKFEKASNELKDALLLAGIKLEQQHIKPKRT